MWEVLTPGMYAELDGMYWLATKYGSVVIGEYEWREGRSPDGFNTVNGYRLQAREITHIMPLVKPELPK